MVGRTTPVGLIAPHVLDAVNRDGHVHVTWQAASPPCTRRRAGGIFETMRRYLDLSRTHTYSLLFVLPLFLLYEAGAAWLAAQGGTPLRNGADVMLRTLLAAGGVHGTLAFTGVLAVAAAVIVWWDRRRRRVPLRPRLFGAMAAESVVYALLLGLVVGTATHWLVGGVGARLAVEPVSVSSLPISYAIVLSLGAGLYEELVFRVLLVSALLGTLLAAGLARRQAAVSAVLLAALAFSAFHYVGPYADAWELPSFVFRFLAGLVFSALFLARGFGITAWTHALYDVFLFVGRAA